MDKQTLIERLKTASASPSCCDVIKQAVKVYLASLAFEKIAVDNLLAALEDNLVDIDEMLETAHNNDEALKASGAKYCNCLACTVAREVLDNKDLLRS